MIGRILRGDTLRRRIALTIVAAMLASVALNALFIQVAGIWARPPIERTGLLEQIAVTSRLIEVAPADLRPQLAQAASSDMLQVVWKAQRADFGLPNDGARVEASRVPVLEQLLGVIETSRRSTPATGRGTILKRITPRWCNWWMAAGCHSLRLRGVGAWSSVRGLRSSSRWD